MVLDQNTLLMPVKLPEKLAEELYYYLIANTPLDVCNQDAILQGTLLLAILNILIVMIIRIIFYTSIVTIINFIIHFFA